MYRHIHPLTSHTKSSLKSVKHDYFGKFDVKREQSVNRSVPGLGAASFVKTDLGTARSGTSRIGGLQCTKASKARTYAER